MNLSNWFKDEHLLKMRTNITFYYKLLQIVKFHRPTRFILDIP